MLLAKAVVVQPAQTGLAATKRRGAPEGTGAPRWRSVSDVFALHSTFIAHLALATSTLLQGDTVVSMTIKRNVTLPDAMPAACDGGLSM